VALGADVRKLAEAQALCEQTKQKFGSLDIVVNNAGIIRDKTVRKMAEDDWQAIIDTNLTGVFNVCKVAADALNDGGRIVNFASIAAVVGFFGQSNYAAAKAGVSALTKVLSRELARRRITVNAVAPGVVLTEMGKTIPEEVRAKMLENIPLGRFGEPSEISNVVLFLCSDLASYVTGQTIHVNGGWWG
ncbi:MAG: SDR family oxidoreductase, partial [Verrucomicrobiota bacterium]